MSDWEKKDIQQCGKLTLGILLIVNVLSPHSVKHINIFTPSEGTLLYQLGREETFD